MSRWFRVYDDMVDDPKVQRLPDALFKALMNLWCLASKNDGAFPAVDEIGFKLRMKPEKVVAMIAKLTDAGLIDEFETTLRPHNWRNRQYKSDVSTDRVKLFRKRRGNVSSTVSETRPDTETERLLSSDGGEARKKNGQAARRNEAITASAELAARLSLPRAAEFVPTPPPRNTA